MKNNFSDTSFAPPSNPFSSFWMAGFECTDQLNAFGERVDFINTTGHLQLLEEDYRQLSQFNMRTVREGIRWSQVEKTPYHYDWSTVAYMLEKGKEMGIQQVWDLCHFGFPDDITPLHPMFARRFSALCRAFVKFYRSFDPDGPLIVTPINEVSFLSWLGGDARGTPPYCNHNGWEVKYGLMKAYIEGVAALREEDATIRILTTEPLVNMVPPVNASSEDLVRAAQFNEYQYQAVDMLCGRICPELGGKSEYLDILGFNYYYNNQWIIDIWQFLPWLNEVNDPRWIPLRQSLITAYERYHKPIAITETSHPQEDRPLWMNYVAKEVEAVLKQGIPLWGVCIYPVIDRPDWDHLTPWHNAGLWDVELKEGEPPARVLYEPFAKALLKAQKLIANAKRQTVPKPAMAVAQNF